MSTAPAKAPKARPATKAAAKPAPKPRAAAAKKKPAADVTKVKTRTPAKAAAKRPAAKAATKRATSAKPAVETKKLPVVAKARPVRKAVAKPAESPGLVATLAGISTAAVARATGHGWNYWLLALDKAGAAALPHREIVAVLYKKLGLKKSWWLQMITVGYEQARGLRKLNEKSDGFVATVSRTISVPISALFAAWEEGRRGDWLPDAIEVRRATRNKSMRITWPDGSGVDVNFYDKGGNKAIVAIEAGKLPDEGAVAAVKQLWGSTLDRLKSTLEGKS